MVSQRNITVSNSCSWRIPASSTIWSWNRIWSNRGTPAWSCAGHMWWDSSKLGFNVGIMCFARLDCSFESNSRCGQLWSRGPRQKANSSACSAIAKICSDVSTFPCFAAFKCARWCNVLWSLSHVRNSYCFDWTRSSLDGLLHCMDNRFEAWNMTSQTTFIAELPLHFSSLLISSFHKSSESRNFSPRALGHIWQDFRTYSIFNMVDEHVVFGGTRWGGSPKTFHEMTRRGRFAFGFWDLSHLYLLSCSPFMQAHPSFLVSWALATWCRRFHAIGSSAGSSWLG